MPARGNHSNCPKQGCSCGRRAWAESHCPKPLWIHRTKLSFLVSLRMSQFCLCHKDSLSVTHPKYVLAPFVGVVLNGTCVLSLTQVHSVKGISWRPQVNHTFILAAWMMFCLGDSFFSQGTKGLGFSAQHWSLFKQLVIRVTYTFNILFVKWSINDHLLGWGHGWHQGRRRYSTTQTGNKENKGPVISLFWVRKHPET